MKNIQKDRKDNRSNSEGRDNYFKFITTLTILLILFILTYFLMGLFYTKEIDLNKKDDQKEEVNIDNRTIMLSQLLEQSQDEYYVLVYNVSDKDSLIKSWISIYEGSDGALTLYKVDSSKKFNSNYIVEENSNKNATTLGDLKVISPTLIKVKDKNIVEYIEGEDEIINVFKQK